LHTIEKEEKKLLDSFDWVHFMPLEYSTKVISHSRHDRLKIESFLTKIQKNTFFLFVRFMVCIPFNLV